MKDSMNVPNAPNQPNSIVQIGSSRLSRRTMLRASGLALGLPLLEAMTPAGRSAYASKEALQMTDVSRPVRMACVFFPNGVIQPSWRPKVDGDNWEMGETLKPLEAFKDKLNVISNLAHENGRAGKDGAGDHARGGSTFLTAARPVKTSSNIRLGISLDQVAATALAGQTRLPSIELGLNGSRNAGSCDSGYSCAYSSNISWKNESQPMPKETIPRLAFERMFGSGDAAMERKQRLARKSILDVVRGDAERLMKQVGKTDKRKLDEYFTSVREIETRIEQTEAEDRKSLPDLEVPMGRVTAFREHARLMYDLMVVGFQTDTTRVATFMLDTAGGNRTYPEIGVKEAHHGLSHHRDKTETVEKIQKIDHYLVEQFAYFLERLDSVEESGGTLLDNSMVLYGSGLGDGNRHTHHDLPIVLAGGGGGQIKTGRYLQAAEETPMANLFLSMLDVVGTPAEEIGDSTGRLSLS
ncbi:DUF1552 domain-containing protein [Rhodopirellula baltica]|uniref:Secreted protein containing DUF1552 n=3 Tax=Rhodopirellula baltica TaxID=265606 RepID=Q7UUL2_RHOBA|nr:DUF1552 domain-containing protein [Rhodopirellula baltica]EGF25357.1 protein containing DUF1552 [Rhodopirellula baltica WH47]ELP33345.1 protein containing DUF1552 [Rhodopirellula baltica SWK14]CAD73067.1 hypothetical protein RB3232 [Rhodopirellula baltica SH 1]HBE61727.1 DUF1552 domain-containing protein [Rhodopirellula baltica]